MYKVNQKVYNPLYGFGVVVLFEDCSDVRANNCTLSYTYEQKEGVRIGVKLDNPLNWSLSNNNQNLCFFYPNELEIV